MKPKIIAVSLACLAAGLLAATAYVRLAGPPAPISPSGNEPSASNQGEPGGANPAAPAAKGAAASFSWRQIESDQYPQFIANLRSIGCPEQTIRDLITADVNKLFAEREKPLKQGPGPTAENPAGETAAQKLERLRELRALQLEKRAVLKELLGIEMPLDLLPSSGSRDYRAFEAGLSYLPAEKRDAVQNLQENYWQQYDALRNKYGTARTPEYTAEARQLQDSFRQELAKVLTPQELEDYDLRTSPTAKQLGSSLATYFRPSEDEFRQIFRARRTYEEALEKLSATQTPRTAPPADPAERAAYAQQRAAERQAIEQARAAAQTQMNDQLKTALGDSRYTDYERSQDRSFDMLARLGTRYSLPQETVLQAYELRKSFNSRQGQSAQPPDRAALQKQFDEELAAILGEQAARGLRRANGGTIPMN
jgi:hypothetical protein